MWSSNTASGLVADWRDGLSACTFPQLKLRPMRYNESDTESPLCCKCRTHPRSCLDVLIGQFRDADFCRHIVTPLQVFTPGVASVHYGSVGDCDRSALALCRSASVSTPSGSASTSVTSIHMPASRARSCSRCSRCSRIPRASPTKRAKKLRDDRKLLVHVATQAQHACDLILNRVMTFAARSRAVRGRALHLDQLADGTEQITECRRTAAMVFYFIAAGTLAHTTGRVPPRGSYAGSILYPVLRTFRATLFPS